MFYGGIQPNPIFSVFYCFQYQNNPRFLSGLYWIIRALPHRLTPVIPKIKFNCVSIGYTIAAGRGYKTKLGVTLRSRLLRIPTIPWSTRRCFSCCKLFILFFSLCLSLLFSSFLGLFPIAFFSISSFWHQINLRQICMITIITLLSVYYMYLKIQCQSCASAKFGRKRGQVFILDSLSRKTILRRSIELCRTGLLGFCKLPTSSRLRQDTSSRHAVQYRVDV